MKRCDTVMENIITWFKYLYIFHIICAGNSLLFDTPLLKVTSVLVLILGVVAVFWRIYTISIYKNVYNFFGTVYNYVYY